MPHARASPPLSLGCGLRVTPTHALRCSSMLIAVEQLAALESSMQRGVADCAAESLVAAGCHVIMVCIHASAHTHIPEQVLRFLSCAQFLLRSGMAAQLFLLQAFEDRLLSASEAANRVGLQLMALDGWLVLPCSLPPSISPAGVATYCAPPVLLHQWLRQLLGTLSALEPPSGRAGGHHVQIGHVGGCMWPV